MGKMSLVDDADPLVLLSRALHLLESKEANDRYRTDQREQTERERIAAQKAVEEKRIEQVEAVNAASLRKIVETLESSREDGGSSGEREA